MKTLLQVFFIYSYFYTFLFLILYGKKLGNNSLSLLKKIILFVNACFMFLYPIFASSEWYEKILFLIIAVVGLAGTKCILFPKPKDPEDYRWRDI